MRFQPPLILFFPAQHHPLSLYVYSADVFIWTHQLQTYGTFILLNVSRRLFSSSLRCLHFSSPSLHLAYRCCYFFLVFSGKKIHILSFFLMFQIISGLLSPHFSPGHLNISHLLFFQKMSSFFFFIVVVVLCQSLSVFGTLQYFIWKEGKEDLFCSAIQWRVAWKACCGMSLKVSSWKNIFAKHNLIQKTCSISVWQKLWKPKHMPETLIRCEC